MKKSGNNTPLVYLTDLTDLTDLCGVCYNHVSEKEKYLPTCNYCGDKFHFQCYAHADSVCSICSEEHHETEKKYTELLQQNEYLKFRLKELESKLKEKTNLNN